MFKVCVDPKPKLSFDSDYFDYSKQIKVEIENTNPISSYSIITSKETPRRSTGDSMKIKMQLKNETLVNESKRASNTTKKLGKYNNTSNEGFKEIYEINKVIKQNKNKKNSWMKKEVNIII